MPAGIRPRSLLIFLVQQYRNSYHFYAGLAMAVFIFCGAIQVVFESLLHLFSGWTAENVVGRLRVRALRSLLYRPMESFDEEARSPAACVTTIAKYAQPCLGVSRAVLLHTFSFS